jgi:hypothetical protein
MGRSTAYWEDNPYRRAEPEPEPSAPYRDLPPGVSDRFRRARSGLRELRGVAEQVRFMGTPWGWAWEYAVGSRKLCWLHPVTSGASATFTLTADEERKAGSVTRLAAPIREAIRNGQRTGPVKWCWVAFPDQRHVAAFLGFVRRKAEWLADEPAARRGAKV